MCGALPPLLMPIHGLVLKLKDSVAFVPLFIVWKLIHCYTCILKLREVIADLIALCVEVEKIMCNENIFFFYHALNIPNVDMDCVDHYFIIQNCY
jgi:hypothetical protein